MFSAYLLMFVIHDAQVGVGLPGFQRVIYEAAGHDAWVSVIIAGIYVQVLTWMIIKTLELSGGKDLFDIHRHVYGKIIGDTFNFVMVLYYLFATIVSVRNYVEMVQIWLFPYTPTWVISLLMTCLAFYGVSGGLRTIVGSSVVFVSMTLWMAVLLYFPLVYSDWDHLFPLLESDVPHLLEGSMKMSLTIVGFEILYFIYPFIRNKEKTQLYSQIGVLSVTLLNLFVMFVTLVFFSGGELLKTGWATFTMLKVIQFPFLERFEYLGVSLWLVIVITNLMVFSWIATRGLKRIFSWKQKNSLYGFMGLAWILSSFIETRIEVDMLNNLFSQCSFYLILLYPVVLYLLVRIQAKSSKNKGKGEMKIEKT
ncbi:hypothetical protein SY83_14495 [Paenibacillus swuensis]|uniref:Uncharacterized protein n=2 Tax=Paenibacillus swuensis TaxID=1178515 RepID=A0A172TPU9_9BACL|nr:hypothetical protein SY83_14495 [Paenibacillus swuensis]